MKVKQIKLIKKLTKAVYSMLKDYKDSYKTGMNPRYSSGYISYHIYEILFLIDDLNETLKE